MPTERKENVVKVLEEKFSKATVGVITNYRGLKTPEVNELRRKLRENNAEYKVIKDSLAEIAAKNTGHTYLDKSFKGPVGVAFGYGDAAKTVKVVADYLRTSKSAMKMEWGFLDKRVMTGAEMEALAKLPSREVLLAKVMGGLQGPMYGLVSVISAQMRGLAQVLNGRVKQMEGK